MPLCKPPVIIENRSTWLKVTLILLINKSPCQLCSDLSMPYHGIYILHHGIEFKNNFNSSLKTYG